MWQFLLLLIAVDLTGTWSGKRDMPGGGPGMESTFTFKADGTKITGTFVSPMGEMPITDVKVKGNKVSFSVRMKMGGEERRMNWSGRVEGDDLVLKMERPAGFGPPPGGGPDGGPVGPPPGGPDGSAGPGLPGNPGGPGGPPPGGGPGGPGGPFGGELRVHKLTADEAAAREKAKLKPMPLPERHVLAWNGLAATPPMGWNSYNKFRVNITDKEVREIADAMVSSGMKAAGYQYIVIDDGWEGVRDSRGRLQPNAKFPDMKGLVDYVHSKGLKAGLWATPGPRACSPNYTGSYGHEKEDAEQWAEWGMDYIKFDWCSAGGIYTPEQQPLVYQKQAELLRATGRPIVFSICQYGDNRVFEWGAAAGGNLWRTTFDIRDAWDSMSSIGFRQSELAQYAGPGHWNDPDILEVGNGGMSATEYRTHFSLWSIVAAPLMAGNDLRNMPQETLEILTNREVIAINQDKLGKAGSRVAKQGDVEVWAKPLDAGDLAVALFNRSTEERPVTAKWAELGLTGPHSVRDLWAHKDLGTVNNQVAANVPSHGVVLLRIGR